MANPFITFAISKDGTQKSTTKEITGGGGWSVVNDVVPAETTDREINCSIDASNLKAIYIVCDTALTLEANDGSSPDFTLTLAAGVPLVWCVNSGITNPITADVTSFFATKAGAGDATLEIYVEQDPTP